ncbi:MAG: hypothetical protein ACI4QT_04180 [Kiritimatiellia bacterium]
MKTRFFLLACLFAVGVSNPCLANAGKNPEQEILLTVQAVPFDTAIKTALDIDQTWLGGMPILSSVMSMLTAQAGLDFNPGKPFYLSLCTAEPEKDKRPEECHPLHPVSFLLGLPLTPETITRTLANVPDQFDGGNRFATIQSCFCSQFNTNLVGNSSFRLFIKQDGDYLWLTDANKNLLPAVRNATQDAWRDSSAFLACSINLRTVRETLTDDLVFAFFKALSSGCDESDEETEEFSDEELRKAISDCKTGSLLCTLAPNQLGTLRCELFLNATEGIVGRSTIEFPAQSAPATFMDRLIARNPSVAFDKIPAHTFCYLITDGRTQELNSHFAVNPSLDDLDPFLSEVLSPEELAAFKNRVSPAFDRVAKAPQGISQLFCTASEQDGLSLFGENLSEKAAGDRFSLLKEFLAVLLPKFEKLSDSADQLTVAVAEDKILSQFYKEIFKGKGTLGLTLGKKSEDSFYIHIGNTEKPVSSVALTDTACSIDSLLQKYAPDAQISLRIGLNLPALFQFIAAIAPEEVASDPTKAVMKFKNLKPAEVTYAMLMEKNRLHSLFYCSGSFLADIAKTFLPAPPPAVDPADVPAFDTPFIDD